MVAAGHVVLAAGAVVGVLSTIPFGITAMDYRHRDNGLSYILLVSGVGVWNGMFAVQLLSPAVDVKSFFLSLAVVGSLGSGLGWFLFASTASRTSLILDQRSIYTTIAVLSGLDIALAVTTPVHSLYWTLPSGTSRADGFAVIDPQIGYWLHIAFLVGLFVAGALLFAGTWQAQQSRPYPQAYTIAGTGVALAVVGSAVLFRGGLSLAPPLAVTLTTIGWLQARQTSILASVRTALQPD